MDVRGGVCKVFGVSVCVFLLIRHDREVATHSSCTAKSSHFVRLVPASPDAPASGLSGLSG